MKAIKPEPIVEFISSSLIKIVVFEKRFFSKKFKEKELFWRKMGDKNTGEFLFFNKDSNYIKNIDAQLAIEKLIKGDTIYIQK